MERVIEKSKFLFNFITKTVKVMAFDPLIPIGITFLLSLLLGQSHFYVFQSETFLILGVGSFYAGYAAEIYFKINYF